MYLNEQHAKKWAPVLDHAELSPITDPYKRAVTALVLENQERALFEERQQYGQLWEAGTVAGMPGASAVGGGMSPVVGGEGGIKGFDPILIGLVRRALPNLMAYDICGVQPMTGPTGLIFAMRSTYASATARAGEALYQEANTGHSGNAATGTAVADFSSINPANANSSIFGLANSGAGFGTSFGESANLSQMSFQIDRVAVTAKTRGLQATYSLELAQDLKAVHGLDAETELVNILSTEILAEINREVVRTVYASANVGIVGETSNTVNLSSTVVSDAAGGTSGRWAVEKYKSLLFQVERAANKIAKDTRRGKGNIVIVSTDVASALAMTGLLDYNSALTGQTNLTVDDTGNTFAGTLFGRIKVYVDPYSVSGVDFVTVGYKGTNAYDAGLFYCPYVPLQMVRAVDPQTYQPRVGFKTRYGLVANPFATGAGTGAITDNTNYYYRKFVVLGINQ
jgi:hypothetical protein